MKSLRECTASATIAELLPTKPAMNFITIRIAFTAEPINVTGVVESLLYGGVFGYGAVGARLVYLYQILINHASGTEVEVSYLRVTHLSVGQPYVLSAGEQLRGGILSFQRLDIFGMRVEDGIAGGVVAIAVTVENH